jgi:hypothetical protein
MLGNHPNAFPGRSSSARTSSSAPLSDPLREVEEAAALNGPADFEHEHSAPELQAAVAMAVTRGAPIRDVATAAHMTSLEVLDAADSLTYPSRRQR